MVATIREDVWRIAAMFDEMSNCLERAAGQDDVMAMTFPRTHTWSRHLLGILASLVIGRLAVSHAQTPQVSNAPNVNTSGVRLRFMPRSTIKLEQLLGDEDKERRQPTRSQTVTRYDIQGTDLGYSFDHQGRTYFLFG